MQPAYEHNYPLLMNAHDKNAFRFGVIVFNTEAFNDATKTALEWFLTWDIFWIPCVLSWTLPCQVYRRLGISSSLDAPR